MQRRPSDDSSSGSTNAVVGGYWSTITSTVKCGCFPPPVHSPSIALSFCYRFTNGSRLVILCFFFLSLASRLPSKTKVKRCLSAHCRSRCLSAHCSTRVALRFLCSTCDRQRPSRRSSTLRYTCCAKASRGAPTIEWVSVLGQDAGTRGAALSSVMGYAKSAEPLSVVLSCFL